MQDTKVDDSTGAKAVARLYTLLDRPGAPYQLDLSDGQLKITPLGADTFPIEVDDDGEEATIFAGPWHGHFDDVDEAQNCVMGLLSPYYRLAVLYSGDRLESANIECYQSEGWVGLSLKLGFPSIEFIVGRILGKPRRLVTYQQAVIAPSTPWNELFPGAVLDENNLPVGSHLGVYEVPRHPPRNPS